MVPVSKLLGTTHSSSSTTACLAMSLTRPQARTRSTKSRHHPRQRYTVPTTKSVNNTLPTVAGEILHSLIHSSCKMDLKNKLCCWCCLHNIYTYLDQREMKHSVVVVFWGRLYWRKLVRWGNLSSFNGRREKNPKFKNCVTPWDSFTSSGQWPLHFSFHCSFSFCSHFWTSYVWRDSTLSWSCIYVIILVHNFSQQKHYTTTTWK
jgi:hypothetical protein